MLGLITAINALTTSIGQLKATMDLILGQVTLIAINTTPAEDTTPDDSEPQGENEHYIIGKE